MGKHTQHRANTHTGRVLGTAVAVGSALTLGPIGSAFATNGVTALLVGGQGSYAVLTEDQMATAFGGYFAPYDQRISVPFPGDADFSVSIPEGATNLYNAVYAHQAMSGTPITIGGVSKGAPSVIEALKRLETDRENTTDGTEPPPPDMMNVMIYGAPSRIYYGGVRYRPDLPVTPYDVVMVSAEYDGVADMPDNKFNILAVLNAVQGGDMLHVDAAFNTDFANDPMHYKVETNGDGGTVTTIIIPYTSPVLPLLMPMLEAGADPARVAKLSAALKPIIDSAYKRNRFSEQQKWIDGIVNIPLPAAAQPDVGSGDSGTSSLVTQRTTFAYADAVNQQAPTPDVEEVGDNAQFQGDVRDEVKDDIDVTDDTDDIEVKDVSDETDESDVSDLSDQPIGVDSF